MQKYIWFSLFGVDKNDTHIFIFIYTINKNMQA